MRERRHWGSPLPLLVAAGGLGAVGVAAVALAAPAASRSEPLVSVTVPAEVVSGAEFVVAGRISDLGTGGRVVSQVEGAGGWKTLGRGSVRGRRFKVPSVLSGEG